MPTPSRRFGSLAFALQPLGGPFATAPMFKVPLIGGGLGPMSETGDLPRIGSTLSRLGKYSQRKRGGGTVRILAHPEALGMLLYFVCGAQSNSGSDPVEHVFTITDDYPASTSMTFWSNVGTDGLIGGTYLFEDAFITRMSIEGRSGENLEVEMEIASMDYHPRTTIPAVSGAGSSSEDDEPRFKYIGSVVKLSPDQNIPTDEYSAERVLFEIDRAVELRYGPSLTPQLVVPDRLVNFTASWTFDSDIDAWDFLNMFAVGAITGSLTGLGADQLIPDASFDFQSGRHPADATRYLKIASNGRNWQYEMTRPDAEAQPGTLELEATGIVVFPDAAKGGSGSTEVTITLENDFTGDYS